MQAVLLHLAGQRTRGLSQYPAGHAQETPGGLKKWQPGSSLVGLAWMAIALKTAAPAALVLPVVIGRPLWMTIDETLNHQSCRRLPHLATSDESVAMRELGIGIV